MRSVRPKIVLVNRAPGSLSDSAALKIMTAVQRQVTGDFARAWGIDASLTYLRAGSRQAPDPAAWLVVVCQNKAHAEELGYHDLTPQGKPAAVVFAEDPGELSVTISHEVLEMLADPQLNGFEHHRDSKLLYAREVCDAVEADSYAISGVRVSDFVYPAYFQDGSAGPYNQRRTIKTPFEIADGGYLPALDPTTGEWVDLGFAAEPGYRLERRLRAHTEELARSAASTHAPLAAPPKPAGKVLLRQPLRGDRQGQKLPATLPRAPLKVPARQPLRGDRLSSDPSPTKLPERAPLRGFRKDQALAIAAADASRAAHDPVTAVVESAEKAPPPRQPLRGFRAEQPAPVSDAPRVVQRVAQRPGQRPPVAVTEQASPRGASDASSVPSMRTVPRVADRGASPGAGATAPATAPASPAAAATPASSQELVPTPPTTASPNTGEAK